MITPKIQILSLVAMAVLTAGCGCTSAPTVNTDYPKVPKPATPQPVVIAPDHLVYTLYLEIETNDAEAAADRAEEYMREWGGYPISRESWQEDYRHIVYLDWSVPFDHKEPLRRDLITLGNVLQQIQSTNPRPDSHSPFAEVTIRFDGQPIPIDYSPEPHPCSPDFFTAIWLSLANLMKMCCCTGIFIVVGFAVIGCWSLIRRLFQK